MKYSHYLIATLGACLLPLSLVMAFNYTADHYHVFGTVENHMQMPTEEEPNTRAIKFKKLSADCSSYTGIIFGTSRAAAYRTADIRHIYGYDSYNYSVSLESLRGILYKLSWLVNHDCKPKHVFVPLSPDHFKYYNRDYSMPPYDFIRMEAPSLIGRIDYFFEFIKNYLLSLEITEINLRPLKQLATDRFIDYNFVTGDTEYNWDLQFDISECPPSMNIFQASRPGTDITINYLLQIHELAKSNNIGITLLWNPIVIEKQWASENIIYFFEAIKSVFHDINRIPFDDERLASSANYHDPSHFKNNLAHDVLLPENRVSISRFVNELKQHTKNCTAKSPTKRKTEENIRNPMLTNGVSGTVY